MWNAYWVIMLATLFFFHCTGIIGTWGIIWRVTTSKGSFFVM